MVVYYHLKNPVGAFEAIQHIMNDNAMVCIEGECILYYAETKAGERVMEGIEQLATGDIPFALCYPGTYKRGENWFIPNFACFEGWLKAAGLNLLRHRFWEDRTLKPYPGQRIIAVANKPIGAQSLKVEVTRASVELLPRCGSKGGRRSAVVGR